MASPSPSPPPPGAPPPPSAPGSGLDTIAIGGIVFAGMAVAILLVGVFLRAYWRRPNDGARRRVPGMGQTNGVYAHVPETAHERGAGAFPEGLPLLHIKATSVGAV